MNFLSSETGLGYHNARYYLSWLGRWERADPIGLKAGPNRYSYVRNAPIRLSDPSGEEEELDALLQGLYAGAVEFGKEGLAGTPSMIRMLNDPVADLAMDIVEPLWEEEVIQPLEAYAAEQLHQAMGRDETAAQAGAFVGYFGATALSVVVGPENLAAGAAKGAQGAIRVVDEVAAAASRTLDEVSAGLAEVVARLDPVPVGGPGAIPARTGGGHVRSPQQQARLEELAGRNGSSFHMAGPKSPGSGNASKGVVSLVDDDLLRSAGDFKKAIGTDEFIRVNKALSGDLSLGELSGGTRGTAARFYELAAERLGTKSGALDPVLRAYNRHRAAFLRGETDVAPGTFNNFRENIFNAKQR